MTTKFTPATKYDPVLNTFGYYCTVLARTACFVTVEHDGVTSKRKITVKDDVESFAIDGLEFYASAIWDGFETCEDALNAEYAAKHAVIDNSLPCDIEVYEPLIDTETETAITGGGVDWLLVSVDDQQICTLEAAWEPREIGYPVKTANIHVATLQKIMGWDNEEDDDDFEIIELEPIDDGEELDLELIESAKPEIFQAGRIYEIDSSGMLFKFEVQSRTDKTVTMTKGGVYTIFKTDDHEYIRPFHDNEKLYADTPEWFHRVTDSTSDELNADLELARIRLMEDLRCDRALVRESSLSAY